MILGDTDSLPEVVYLLLFSLLFTYLLIFLFVFFFTGGTAASSQGLVLVRQAFYYLSHSSSPVCLWGGG
jgi:hypothetical protein